MTRRDQQHAHTLKRIFDQLNYRLAAHNLPCLTYKDLGGQVEPNIGKSAVSNLLNGTYESATAGAHLDRIAKLLQQLCTHHNFTPALSRPQQAVLSASSVSSVKSVVEGTGPDTVRVSEFGFFRYNGHHYYAGAFSGQRITVQPGDEPGTAVIAPGLACDGLVAALSPIDPKTTQLPPARI